MFADNRRSSVAYFGIAELGKYYIDLNTFKKTFIATVSMYTNRTSVFQGEKNQKQNLGRNFKKYFK